MLLERCLDIIEATARVPSFSSFEERLHPLIFEIAEGISACTIHTVRKRNLVLRIPGKACGRVALTAHLDKINHFGEKYPDALPFERHSTFIKGQLDNTVGIGIVLSLMELAANEEWPEILILLSEMEESTGLNEHPHLLRNKGKKLYHGMGAERLSEWLINHDLVPEAIVTIDTTPLFRGEPGCAVYSKHWEFTKTTPTEEETGKTARLVQRILDIDPSLHQANNTNDYLTYGKLLNTGSGRTVPSIAVEPAIHPYHTKNEQVFIRDIERVLSLMATLLNTWNYTGAGKRE